MISVIVPTNDEEELLPACLESILTQEEDVEVIVVDGASKDNTVKIAKNYTDKIILMDKADLPAQLNTGADQASGEFLLFLHADCRLTRGCLKRIKSIPSKIAGGAFTMQLDGTGLHYRLLSIGGNLYCHITGTYFGDRGIFVRPQVFRQLGGFASMHIMADVEFSRRMKRSGKCVLLKGPVISSSRKFDQDGPLRNLYLVIYALLAYRFGVDPIIIKERYYHQKKGRGEYCDR